MASVLHGCPTCRSWIVNYGQALRPKDRLWLTRPMVLVFRGLLGLVCSVMLGWMALAIYFDFSLLGPPWLRAGLGVLIAVGAVAALWLVRPRRWALAGILGTFAVVLGRIYGVLSRSFSRSARR